MIRALNEAVLGRRSVRIRYRTGRTGELSTRRLDPYRVWYRNGALYAIGHDHKSGEVRTFAVDRIGAAEVTEYAFRVPDDFDFDAYTASAFGVVAEPATPVRIRFEPRFALHVAERVWHPSQRVERLPGGGVELALEVGGHEELRNWILSFGAGAEVLEPAALRAEVEAELGRALERYAGAAPATQPPRGKRGARLVPLAGS